MVNTPERKREDKIKITRLSRKKKTSLPRREDKQGN